MIRAAALGLTALALVATACGSKERAAAVPPADAAVVTVAPAPADAAPAPPPARVRSKILIREDDVWVAGVRGGARVLPCGGDALDTAAVLGALCALQGERSDPAVEIAAAAGVPMGRMVALLDVLLQLGVRDVAAVTPDTLALMVRGDAQSMPVAVARCGERPDPCPALARGDAGGDDPRPAEDPLQGRGVRVTPPRASTGGAVVTATRLTLSPAGISVDGRPLAKAGELAAAAGAVPIASLVEALRQQGAEAPVVIDAAPATPSLFFGRALASCAAAGRTRVSFASGAEAPQPLPPRRATP